MHNNRYSTVEGVMRLFTVDHPQITLSPKGGGGTRRPPPRTCYVLFRPQPLSPAHSWFLVGTTWSPGTSSLYATTWLATRLFGLVQKITRRPKGALV